MQGSTKALIAGGVLLVVLLPIGLILEVLILERRERGAQPPETEPLREAMKEVARVGSAAIGVTAASISIPTTVDNLGSFGNLTEHALVIDVAVQNTSLELSLSAVGERGNVRFRIPAEPLFATPTPPDAKPKPKPII
jgi:hypothetical protein